MVSGQVSSMEAHLFRDVRAGKQDRSAVPELWTQAMKFMKWFCMIMIMLFLIQQVKKIHDDAGYVGRVFDMITDGTSVDELEGK